MSRDIAIDFLYYKKHGVKSVRFAMIQTSLHHKIRYVVRLVKFVCIGKVCCCRIWIIHPGEFLAPQLFA